MKITKSQLKQLVMEELSEQMPEMAENFSGGSAQANVLHSDDRSITFEVTVDMIDGYPELSGVDKAMEQAFSEHGASAGPEDADHLGGMDEGRFGSRKQPSYLQKAQDEEDDERYGKPKGEEQYSNIGSGKGISRPSHYNREKKSDKDAQNENRISKSALNAIIAEEYNKLAKEARGYYGGGYATGRARMYGGGRSYGEPGDMGSDRRAIAADRRQDAMAASDKEHAAHMAQKATPEQEKQLRDLVRAEPKNELAHAALSVISLGNILTRKNYPRIFEDPKIAAIFEK